MYKLTLAFLASTAVLSIVDANPKEKNRFLQTQTPQPSSPPTTAPQPPILQPTTVDNSLPTIEQGSDGTSRMQYSPKMPCFPCIMNDYVYCHQGPDHPHVEIGQSTPQGICCPDKSSCPQLSLPGWTCSNSYSDKLLSLRMCPFDHSKCGNRSEIVFSNPGEKIGQNLTFHPSDLCFFTMRAECGLPSFNPQGLDMVNGIDVYTIEYDDQDVDAVIVGANDTQPTIIDPSSTNGTKMTPRIPLPKKQENFDGKKKNITQTEAYLLRVQQNSDGTSTYFYSNGSSFSYETTVTITFNDLNDPRAYEVQYPSGTNITVNKDGSKTVNSPGQQPSYIPAPETPPPSPTPPPAGAYDYESNLNDGTSFGSNRRRLQSYPPPPQPSPSTYPPPPQPSPSPYPPPPQYDTISSTTPTPVPAPAPSTPSEVNGTIAVPPTPAAPTSSFMIPETPSSFAMVAPPTPLPLPAISAPDFFNFAPLPAPNSSLTPIPSDVWGTVVFYIDGRIRELQANGNSTWIMDFYDAKQNPNKTSLNAFNNTAYLKIRVYTNGSYELNFANGEAQSFLGFNNWSKFYFNQKPEFARLIVQSQKNEDGSRNIRFLNGTLRYFYPPHYSSMTEYQRKIAPMFDDLISYSNSKIINRHFINGTVAQFVNYYFSQYLVAPISIASDMTQTNFSDGSFVRYFEVARRKVFFFPPPNPSDSTYNRAQQILSTEDLMNGQTRVTFRNGTVILRVNQNGDLKGYEVAPVSWQPSFEVILQTPCQWEEIDYIQDIRTQYFCLPNSTWTAEQNATQMRVNITLKDGSRRVAFLNGTIARLNRTNGFQFWEVAPKTKYIEFTAQQMSDGTRIFNYTLANDTIREWPPAMTHNNTPFQRSTATLFRDKFSNGTTREFFVNGTIAVFQNVLNGTVIIGRKLVNYEVRPKWFFGDCIPDLVFHDGRPMVDCTAVDNTQVVFFRQPDFTFTLYENATAPQKDIVNVTNGNFDRVYFNGTIARFNVSENFQFWIIPPKNDTLTPVPTSIQILIGTDGSKTVINGNMTTFYSAPLTNKSSKIENATGILYQQIDREMNQTTTFFRNGSISILFLNNNAFRWIVAPKEFFVPYDEFISTQDGSKVTNYENGRTVVEFKEPSENTPDYERYTAISRLEKFPNGTNIQSYFNGTVAEFRNLTFFGYRVAPKFLIVKIDTIFNADGSQQINFSNGTSIWIAPPPSRNETEEQFAFRVVRVETFSLNFTRIISFANGTIAIYINNTLSGYRVKHLKDFVSRRVEYLADGGIREIFSNGTIRTAFGPVRSDLDELSKSRLVVFEEFDNNTLKVTRRYLNGTVAVFNNKTGQFLQYILAPAILYTGCVTTKQSTGDLFTKCFNDTIRVVKQPITSTATEQEQAVAVNTIEWKEGDLTQTFYYRNGSIGLANRTGEFIRFIRQPEYFWSTSTVKSDAEGNIYTDFANGTLFIQRPRPPTNATQFDLAIRQAWFRDYNNGTSETKFLNGTHIRTVRQPGSTNETITYIKRIDGMANSQADGTFSIAFSNNTQRIFFPPLPSNASELEKAFAREYRDLFLNGSSVIKFLNRTVAFYNASMGFVRYIVAPENLYGEVIRTDYSDGSYQLQYTRNRTVRYFVAPLPANATKKDRALEIFYIEKFTNGTMKRAFVNGTVAVYLNNIFVRYDVRPKEFFDEDRIDTSVEEKLDDGTRNIYFSNGTVRTFDSPANQTDRIYRDCFPNSTCIWLFKNGSRSRFDGDKFIWNQGPVVAFTSPEPPKDPSYNYVNKTGPKIQAYDKSQGGIKKYKEEYQNNDNRGLKSQPQEPLCKGRNQMIIMGDMRIKRAVYTTRILQTTQNETYADEQPSTVALQLESISFVPDTIPGSNALVNRLAATFALVLAFTMIMF